MSLHLNQLDVLCICDVIELVSCRSSIGDGEDRDEDGGTRRGS